MDGIGVTVKNLVYCRVSPRDLVINNPREFAEFANQISSADSVRRQIRIYSRARGNINSLDDTVNVKSSKGQSCS